jgi:hypothetical protein
MNRYDIILGKEAPPSLVQRDSVGRIVSENQYISMRYIDGDIYINDKGEVARI